MHRVYKITVIIFLFTLVFSNITNVFAQNDESEFLYKNYFGIIINPAIEHIKLDPGSIYTGNINLTNDFQHHNTVNFVPLVKLFKQKEESGSPEFFDSDELPHKANAAEWITFHENNYNIGYEESIDSNYTITVPHDAQPGGHYIALAYQETAVGESVQLSLDKTIAALLFVTVNGDTNENGELIDFTVGKPFYDFAPVDFHLRYKNSGNMYSVIGGNIFIHQGDITNPIATLTVNPEGKIVLSESTRHYEEIFNDGFISYDETGFLKINFQKFLKVFFGNYTATLKLKHTVNGERITTEREVSFWVIPWQLIIFLLLIIAIITAVVIKKRDKR